jgi:hypothetical protein
MNVTKLHRLISVDPSIAHDDVRQLSPAEVGKLRAKLEAEVGLDSPQDVLALSFALQGRRKPVEGFNAESEDFNLADCLLQAGLVRPQRVCLNWMHFIEVDSVSFDVLAKHFDDFWYPKADDIDLFDESCKWVLSIDCDGFPWVVTFTGL